MPLIVLRIAQKKNTVRDVVCILWGRSQYSRLTCVCIWVRTQARRGYLMLWERWAWGDSLQLGLSHPGTLQDVSPRIAQRKWNTLYPWSPAGQLWQGRPSITQYQHLSTAPLSFFLLAPSCSLQHICVCSARSVQGRKIGRRVGAGWQVPTIGCLEIPESTRNFQRRLYLG